MKKEVLVQPVISEKSFFLAEKENKYTFKVSPSVNRMEVANAIAEKFDVTVESVNISNVRGKKVRFGKTRKEGSRSNWKKAVIKLAEGDKIEIFDIK